MRVTSDQLMATVTATVTHAEIARLTKLTKCSDLVAKLLGLMEVHGDLPVYDATHCPVEAAWFRASDEQDARPLPNCIMVG